MPFILNMEQLLLIADRLPIVLSGKTERLMLQCEERVILRIEKFLLMMDAEGLRADLKDLNPHLLTPHFVSRLSSGVVMTEQR